MRIGDIVMYVETEKYPNFFGKIGKIAKCTKAEKENRELTIEDHARIEWLEPVQHGSRHTTYSHFPLKYFQNNG